MESNNWQQIEEIFHTALELDSEERRQYLEQISNRDNQLRMEVDSLLESFEKNADFIETAVLDEGLKALHFTTLESLIDKTVGDYKIVRKLGEGGMGEVYLAEDTRLKRQVALKFLNSIFVGDKWARKQLMREAQAAALLNNPHICATYAFEEFEEHSFIVLEHIDGQNLAELIKNQALAKDQLLIYSSQIIEAIVAAHNRHIIHRDIKSGNIMVTSDGTAKVLDFGLAKVIQRQNQAAMQSASVTRKDLIVGTIAYMSPEQLRAEKLDLRSDIFSLGIVLYEMFAGINPFLCQSDAETISAVLNYSPPLIPEVPLKISRLINKCLEKNKESRYQSADELLLDFQQIEKPPPLQVKINFALIAAVCLVTSFLSLLVVFGVSTYKNSGRPRKLAVFPIVNETADSNLKDFSESVTEGIIDRLSSADNIKVEIPSTIKQSGASDDELEIARRLVADAYLTTKIIQSGERRFLQTKLISATNGVQIWSLEESLETNDSFALQKEIAEKIYKSMVPWNNSQPELVQTTRQTNNPEAFKFYWNGRYYWKKRDEANIQLAIENFSRAIDADPSYARAYAGLADSYVLLNSVAYGSVPTREAMTKAEAAARDAIRLDDTLCESHVALGLVEYKYYWNRKLAENEFRHAIELDPNYAPAHYWYSNLLAVEGRPQEALAESMRAKDLDPFSPQSDMNVGRVLYYAHEFDNADQYLSSILKNEPGNMKVQYLLGLVYLQKHSYGQAVDIFEKIYNSKDGKLLAAAALGFTYGKLGMRGEALKIIGEIEKEEAANHKIHVPSQEKAIIYVGINDRNNAFLWLERSYNERLATLNAIEVEPLFDDLRSDSRYLDLVKRINSSQ